MPKIIEVDKGDFRAFVYEGDIAAMPRPDWKTLPAAPLSPLDFVEQWQPSRHDLLLLLTAWYAAENIPTAFLDIGANIGTDAIRAAKLSRLMELRFPIVAFEPGVNAKLLPYTLKLNDLADTVMFEELCLSDNDKPTVLFGEAGTSVNNRIVNRLPDTEGFSKIVFSTTIDAYLNRPEMLGRHPIAKIDTQGAEWLIWRGMQETIAERQITLVMEFTPWALQPFVPPARFLDELSSRFMLFDLGQDRGRFTPIDDFDAFLIRTGSPPYWTDILCVSRSLPSAGRLIHRIIVSY